jgi:integrase
MAERLTIARINAVKFPAGKVEVRLWDSAVVGLCLRCFSSGGKTWTYRYREGGGGRSAKIRKLKLGSWPTVGIDSARAAARANAGLVAQGNDPAAVRREHRRQERSTLRTLLAIDGPYERHLVARGLVKRTVALATLRRGLAKHMTTDIARLTRRDLVEALDALNDRPGARHELRKHTRGLLEWAVNSGLVQANVLAGMRAAPKTRQQKIEQAAKRRALTDGDIVAVWKAADREGRFGGLVQLALLTGLRRGELAHLRWDDIGTDDRLTVTAERTKTAAIHQVPLTSLMRGIIDRQTRTTSPLIFPSEVTGKAMADWVRPKDRIVREAGVGHWRLHDLRRSCRSLMSRLGVTENIAELAIGHIKGGVSSLYDLEPRWPERIDAFERVSDHIGRLIGRPE